MYFICCLGYNVVVFGLEIVRFLTCLKIALYVFDLMDAWINDEKCMLEWMYEKMIEKIRENRGFCLFWFSAKTGRELTHVVIYTCMTYTICVTYA